MHKATDLSTEAGSNPPICTKQSPSPSTSSLRDSNHQVIHLEGNFEIIDKIAPRWRELCDENPAAEPFNRPEFIRAYLRAFQPKRTLALIVASNGQRLDAVLPLVAASPLFCGLPAKRLSGPANVHSCRFDLVKRPGSSGQEAVQAIWKFLKGLSDWDVLELPRVPAGGAAEQLSALARLDGFAAKAGPAGCSPCIDLTSFRGVPEGWLGSVGPGLRRTIQRANRDLRKQGDLQCRRVETADEFLPTFQALESAGWKGKKATAIECSADTQTFYHDIVKAAERFHYLRCHFLELNHQVLAGSLGFSYKGRFFGMKITYDENFRSCSPGHFLVHSMLLDCTDMQCTEFDFMPPWSEWKARWTTVSRKQSNWYIFRDSHYGRVLDRVKFSIVPAVKRVLYSRRSPNIVPADTR